MLVARSGSGVCDGTILFLQEAKIFVVVLGDDLTEALVMNDLKEGLHLSSRRQEVYAAYYGSYTLLFGKIRVIKSKRWGPKTCQFLTSRLVCCVRRSLWHAQDFENISCVRLVENARLFDYPGNQGSCRRLELDMECSHKSGGSSRSVASGR